MSVSDSRNESPATAIANVAGITSAGEYSESLPGVDAKSTPIVDVRNLRVSFKNQQQSIKAVRGVDLTIFEGETIGILGESGSGKSVTARTLMGLTTGRRASVKADRLMVCGHDLSAGESPISGSRERGQPVAMIFQNPFTSLNPVFRIGSTLSETLVRRRGFTKADARKEAIRLLDLVRIPAAERRLDSYPHELSGGMQQRVIIALALALEPKLLFADEPTTALDVTVQAQILQLLDDLKREQGLTLALISHDIDVISDISDRIYVMYAGRVVEAGDVESVYLQAGHPYTLGLLRSAPRLRQGRVALEAIPGQPPDPTTGDHGCAFAPRCKFATPECHESRPILRRIPEVHTGLIACHYAKEISAGRDTAIGGS